MVVGQVMQIALGKECRPFWGTFCMMPARLLPLPSGSSRSRERLVIWWTVLELIRRSHRLHFPPGRLLTSDLTLVMLLCAAIATDIEGKPVVAGRLAAYLGLPRETARRNLDRLVKFGLLSRDGKNYLPTEKTLTTDERVMEHIDAIVRMIRYTSQHL
jgi:hypothetical protein